MPVFKNRDNQMLLVPDGDYKFVVIGLEIAISAGQNTKGSDKFDLKFQSYFKDGKPGCTNYDSLIDHESIDWRIDTFLRCANVQLAVNEPYSFRQDEAKRKGFKFIDVYGLSGIYRLHQEEYNGKKRMKVACYYTDKTKFPKDSTIHAPSDPVDQGTPVAGGTDEPW